MACFSILIKITDLSLASIGQFFYIIILVAFVSLLAYYSMKLMANARSGGGRTGNRRNFTIIESIGVGVGAMLQIVRVGERFFLLGVTKEKVTMLSELEEGEIRLPEIKSLTADLPFSKVLQRFMKQEDSPRGEFQGHFEEHVAQRPRNDDKKEEKNDEK